MNDVKQVIKYLNSNKLASADIPKNILEKSDFSFYVLADCKCLLQFLKRAILLIRRTTTQLV